MIRIAVQASSVNAGSSLMNNKNKWVPRTRVHDGLCGELDKIIIDILGLACVRSFWPAESCTSRILEGFFEEYKAS